MMKLSLLMIALAACGGGGSTSVDAAIDGKGVTVDAPHANIDAASGGPMLLVKNFDSWCNVTVNGGTASSSAAQNVAVTAGTINVSAVALSGFILGPKPWHDTAGDTGTGDPGTVTGTGQAASSATTVVVGASGKCIWVCCPFTNGTGCPVTDQCM